MICSRLLLSRGLLGLVASAILVAVVGPGCTSQEGVGDPCRPEREYDPTFTGFDVDEVNVESKSYQCQTRLCLVNHFQGRVTCPFGQKIDGAPSDGFDSACIVPGTAADKVTGAKKADGTFVDPKIGALVKPNLVDRLPDKAVYCSCRCANADGSKDDGANYCDCPDGFTCEQLVGSIGNISSEQLAGGYCIKSGTRYNSASPTAAVPCSATNKKDCGGT